MARKSRKNNDVSNDVVSNISRFTIHTALYIRLSVEDNKNRGNSIEHQQMLLKNFVAVNPEFQVIKTYIDNGKTGTNFERPAMQKLLELVKTYQVNCIIVKHFSRFGRNMIQTGYVRPDRTKVEVEKKNEKQRYYSVKIMQESSCLTERRKLIREHSMTEKQ